MNALNGVWSDHDQRRITKADRGFTKRHDLKT